MVIIMQEPKKMPEKVKQMIKREPSKTDPNGSYTGVPVEIGEKPVQDADDL